MNFYEKKMQTIIKAVRRVLQDAGINIERYRKDAMGVDPFHDMKRLLHDESNLTIFDVGANVGQSIDEFRKTFPSAHIHSFEPSPTTFTKLRENCLDIPGVSLWNYGVGAEDRTQLFKENEYSVMSSFLCPSATSSGQIVRSTEVEVITLDSFSTKHGIDFVHVLKSDTQGYDFEVFKGAKSLMKEDRIALIYFEIIFSDMYKDLPAFHDLMQYLNDSGFLLVTFYKPNFQNDLVSWTDALFINKQFYRMRLEEECRSV